MEVARAECDIHTLQTREGAVPAETVTEGIYDYVENVESGSTLSTPTSSHTGEAPFASEGLGDTVIHLDKVRNVQILFKLSSSADQLKSSVLEKGFLDL